MPERLVISNTSPLLYLHQVGHLGILKEMYETIIVPEAVQRELHAGLSRGVDVPKISKRDWVTIRKVETSRLPTAMRRLGPGEAEVLALGLKNPHSLLLLDDQRAKRAAALRGLICSGTLGVLLKAKSMGILPAVFPVLRRLEKTSMWLSEDLIDMVLTEAGETKEDAHTSHIFISYVSDDDAEVQKLSDELRAYGIYVWRDRDEVSPGQRWQAAIRSAIKEGAFFVACFSRQYLARERSYMNEELALAIEELRLRPTERAWFIPVLLDGCLPPERSIGAGETLRDLQWVNMREWEEGVSRLLGVMSAKFPRKSWLKSIQRALEKGIVKPDPLLGHVACPDCGTPAAEFDHEVFGDDFHTFVYISCPNCDWDEDVEM